MSALGKVVFMRSRPFKQRQYQDPGAALWAERWQQRVLFIGTDGAVLAGFDLLPPGEHLAGDTSDWTLAPAAWHDSARKRVMRLEVQAAVLRRYGLRVA